MGRRASYSLAALTHLRHWNRRFTDTSAVWSVRKVGPLVSTGYVRRAAVVSRCGSCRGSCRHGSVACTYVSENDLTFVRETMQLLEDGGVRTWLFGGWAEELLGLVPPRQHHDLDLVYPAGDFATVDALLPSSDELAEIKAKHLAHKRAFLRHGIMTELILVGPAPGPRGSPVSGLRSATSGPMNC